MEPRGSVRQQTRRAAPPGSADLRRGGRRGPGLGSPEKDKYPGYRSTPPGVGCQKESYPATVVKLCCAVLSLCCAVTSERWAAVAPHTKVPSAKPLHLALLRFYWGGQLAKPTCFSAKPKSIPCYKLRKLCRCNSVALASAKLSQLQVQSRCTCATYEACSRG